MATSSMQKDFIIKDKKAFEQLKKDLKSASKERLSNKTQKSASLSHGEEKLKQFSFR